MATHGDTITGMLMVMSSALTGTATRRCLEHMVLRGSGLTGLKVHNPKAKRHATLAWLALGLLYDPGIPTGPLSDASRAALEPAARRALARLAPGPDPGGDPAAAAAIGDLSDAVARRRAALAAISRAREPVRWAEAQHALGRALLALALRQSGTARLHQTVEVLDQVLAERAFAAQPQARAAALSDLGQALHALGSRDASRRDASPRDAGTGGAPLERAAAAYRAAVAAHRHGTVEWADAQYGLAGTLRTLATQTGAAAPLEEAVPAIRTVLEATSRTHAATAWSRGQTELGAILLEAGAREDGEPGTARVREAVTVLTAALEVRSQTGNALDRADTQVTLARALAELGRRTGSGSVLERAAAAFRTALAELPEAPGPGPWAEAWAGYRRTLALLGQRDGDIRRLVHAVAALRTALEALRLGQEPLAWARTQAALGDAFLALAGRDKASRIRLQAAVGAYYDAIPGWGYRDRHGVAACHANLALARLGLAAHDGDAVLAEQALADLGKAAGEMAALGTLSAAARYAAAAAGARTLLSHLRSGAGPDIDAGRASQ